MELLSPCGGFDSLAAAIEAGADAVYFGARIANARMGAKNFSREEIARAVSICHGAGVRCYVTLNTLLPDRDLPGALSLAEFLYEAGVDALIVADLGLAALLRRYLPDLPLHASTQMTGHSAGAAAFFAERGFSRMVAARELRCEDLRALAARSPIGIECFVHGALCVSASGQCLLSAAMGGRSGNRGECAGPCRLPYNGSANYPLSLKDLCLAGHMREIARSGVVSLKIEGRMKPPAYVSAVTRVYRRLLDEDRDASPEEIAALSRVFSRGGFTDGYFTGRLDRSMLGVRRESDKAASALVKLPRESSPARNLPPIVLSRERPAPIPAPPRQVGAPLGGERVCYTARFYKPETIPRGESERAFFEEIYLPLDRFDPARASGVLLPPILFDRERGAARAALAQALSDARVRHILIANVGQLSLVRDACRDAGRTLAPWSSGDMPEAGKEPMADEVTLHGDFRLGCQNGPAARAMGEFFASLILSPELTLPQIRDIPSVARGGARGSGSPSPAKEDAPPSPGGAAPEKEVIVYGRLPLMVLERQPGEGSLRDRRGAVFPLLREGGRTILLNSVPIYMADRRELLDSAGVRRRHFLFTTEGEREVQYLISCYRKGLGTKKEVRRIK